MTEKELFELDRRRMEKLNADIQAGRGSVRPSALIPVSLSLLVGPAPPPATKNSTPRPVVSQTSRPPKTMSQRLEGMSDAQLRRLMDRASSILRTRAAARRSG